MKIAVIGAGLAGLTCARGLAIKGHEVHVYEKARGPGGRMATRRSTDGQFDHGAQYFTARDSRFSAMLQEWEAAGLVARWPQRIGSWQDGRLSAKTDPEPRYVGAPRMSAVTRRLADSRQVHYQTRITELEPGDDGWRLQSEQGELPERYQRVVVATPAPQAAPLLLAAPRLAAAAHSVRMTPCWAALVTLPTALELELDAVFMDHSVLSWAARDSSKPGRPGGERWVLHGRAEWSEEHKELDAAAAADALLAAFADLAGAPAQAASATAHRWLYAASSNPLADGYLLSAELGLAACGDWCHGNRVEGAFLSGLKLAEALG